MGIANQPGSPSADRLVGVRSRNRCSPRATAARVVTQARRAASCSGQARRRSTTGMVSAHSGEPGRGPDARARMTGTRDLSLSFRGECPFCPLSRPDGLTGVEPGTEHPPRSIFELRQHRRREWIAAGRWGRGGHEHSVTSQTHVAGGALFTAAGLGAANAAGWMHTPVSALAVGIAWGAIAGELPDIDHPKARVSRTGVAFGVAGSVLGLPARIVGVFVRGLRVTHRGPTHSLTFLALWAAIAAPLYAASGGVDIGRGGVGGREAGRGFAHGCASERAVGGAVSARAPGRRVPLRCGGDCAWLSLASGARLAHWSDPVGVAGRSP